MTKFFLISGISFFFASIVTLAYAIGKLRKEVTDEAKSLHNRIDYSVQVITKVIDKHKEDGHKWFKDEVPTEADKFFDEVKKDV